MRTRCQTCGDGLPSGLLPRHLHRALFGGWTCPVCGEETDHQGRSLLHEEHDEDGMRFSLPGRFVAWELAASAGMATAVLASLAVLGSTYDLRGGPAYHAPVGVAELGLFAAMGSTLGLLWIVGRRLEQRRVRVGRTSVQVGRLQLHFAHVQTIEQPALTVVMEDGSRHRLPVGGPRVGRALLDALERFQAAQEQAEPVPERDRRALERARER